MYLPRPVARVGLIEKGCIEMNVNGSDDVYYRYKMPALDVKYQAKNGGTTAVVNTGDVAKAIYRDVADLKRCFSKRMASNIKILDGRLHIPGHHTSGKLQEILMEYIKSEVLCQKCGNPETVVYGSKGKRRCQACGFIA